MLDEYEAMLPKPERARFREDVDRLIRRTLAHDHAHPLPRGRGAFHAAPAGHGRGIPGAGRTADARLDAAPA